MDANHNGGVVMAETRDSKEQEKPRGIAAAAMEGAKQGEREGNVNPDDPAAKLATPGPGMTKQPAASPSSTNQYTGVTGAIRDDQDEEDADEQARRSADGAKQP
jgi:hypothetical protein